MTGLKLFTVFGATGQQGGELIKYLLKHPRFSKTYKIRGVTRDVSKDSARALVVQGVELVEANMNDPVSLKAATKDSHTVFAMTNFWDSASRETETAQGKAIADAVVASSATLLIWSSLPRIGLPNFESKADVEDYIRTLPIKAFFFVPGWFMQNHLTLSRPQKQQDGTYMLGKLAPGIEATSLVPLFDAADSGKFLQPFLDEPEKYAGKTCTACTEFMTPVEMCKIWSSATGVKVWSEGEGGGNIEKEIEDHSGESKDSAYYGVGSGKALKWTLAQMEDKPGSWESFVGREGPWFGEST